MGNLQEKLENFLLVKLYDVFVIGQEIMDALRIAFIESLIKYWEVNRKWPSDIVVFRDGVGDGQLDVTKNHECEQFLAVFNKKRNGKEDTTEVSKMESRYIGAFSS